MPFGARDANGVQRLTPRFSESLIALNLPRGNRQFSRQYFSNFLREPFQMESHAGAFFVFLLLQPSGLLRQQLAEEGPYESVTVKIWFADGTPPWEPQAEPDDDDALDEEGDFGNLFALLRDDYDEESQFTTDFNFIDPERSLATLSRLRSRRDTESRRTSPPARSRALLVR